jgi:hypothetical protein
VRRGEGGRQQGGRGAVGVKRVVETKMRLPKHKMPKEKPVKAQQTVKHKKSEKKALKLAAKEARSEEMEVNSVSAEPKYASEAEREAARLARKKENAHRVLWKKNIKQITGRNGPRAVNG